MPYSLHSFCASSERPPVHSAEAGHARLRDFEHPRLRDFTLGRGLRRDHPLLFGMTSSSEPDETIFSVCALRLE
jgi:hypothetical protein